MAVAKFTSRSYYESAREHLGLAVRLREEGEHFASHYFAGIAVESILRSLCVIDGGSADRTHDIRHWAAKANLMFGGSSKQQDDHRAQITELNLRWRANQIYLTTKMLDTYLESTQLDKIRGDRVKYSSKRLFELATDIVGLGVEKWQSNNRSKRS